MKSSGMEMTVMTLDSASYWADLPEKQVYHMYHMPIKVIEPHRRADRHSGLHKRLVSAPGHPRSEPAPARSGTDNDTCRGGSLRSRIHISWS